MKNTLVPALVLCGALTGFSQTLESVPTDISGFSTVGPPSWSWTDSILGTVTATYTGTNVATHGYRSPNASAAPGFVREGYFSYSNNPLGGNGAVGDTTLTFSWTNPVSTLEVSLGDFDESNAVRTLNFSSNNPSSILTSATLGDIGAEPAAAGYTYDDTDALDGTIQFSLATRGPNGDGLENARTFNGVDVVLGGTNLTTFSLVGASDYINALEVGGITATTVPEPSVSLLGALAGLGLLARRRRA